MTAFHYIDGQLCPALGHSRPVFDPANLEEVGLWAEATEEELERALKAAQRVRPQWASLDAKTRANYLHACASAIENGPLRDIAKTMTLEMGKPFPEAMGELANVSGIFRYCAELARDEIGKVAGPIQSGSFQYSQASPYGLSLHIVPFNFPILLLSWTLAASLAAGNVALVKPAEPTTLCSWQFLELLGKVLPAGVVQGLAGGAGLGKQLVAHPAVSVVAFTGSVAGARSVAVACAEQLKPAILEAGGSDALIVSRQADLEVAIAGSVTAAFHLSGQICTSAERFFVHTEVHDPFVRGLVEGARKLRIGHGLGQSEIGPLVSEAARAKVIRLVEAAQKAGAEVLCGGRCWGERGWFYEPTVLTGVRPDMEIFHEEVFGPVASICRVDSLAEAIGLANQSPFGLGASLFSNDLGEAFEFLEGIESGMAWVNNPLIDNDALPFGGWKQSGLGKALGREGLQAFRRQKMCVIDAKPKRQGWWYPYPESEFYQA
jgi:acyl-CoA reductase-like NAD-dependent aldehyde dehydrogenase